MGDTALPANNPLTRALRACST